MQVRSTPFSAWNTAIGAAIAALDTPAFPARLTEAIKTLVAFDNAMVFAYRGNERPIAPYTDVTAAEEPRIVDGYISGPYLLDPFFAEVRRGRTSGIAALRDIAPDHFYQSEYYKQHYRHTAIDDEIGFFMAVPGDIVPVLSITRRHAQWRFEAAEVRLLATVAPVVTALGARHWTALAETFAAGGQAAPDPDRPAPNPIDTALQAIGENVLSARQTEIVALILKGHSSESIGLLLGISPGTVKIHRKNAYAKLGISSQAELFSLFLDHLRRAVVRN